MNSEEYINLKAKELNIINSDWNFAGAMQDAAKNPEWKSREGLWTILSAACNDAAAQYFQKISHFSRNLIDVDTCGIHALRSLAEEADLGYLMKNISTEYPKEILDLIELFSVNKNYLLGKTDYINIESNEFLYGVIAKRAAELASNEASFHKDGEIEKIPNEIIHDILLHVDEFYVIFPKNLISINRSVKNLLKTDLNDLKLDSNDHDDIQILDTTLKEILDCIKSIKETYTRFNETIDLSTYSLMHPTYTQDAREYKDESTRKEEWQKYLVINVSDGKETLINPFYLFINILRQNFYNEAGDFMLVPMYYDEERNYQVDLRPLVANIINVISCDNEKYIKWFICFHFFNLIKSKLCNKNLQKLFKYDEAGKEFICNADKFKAFEYDKDGNVIDKKEEFYAVMSDWMNDKKIEELLNPINSNGVPLDILSVVNDSVKEFGQYVQYVNEARRSISNNDSVIEDIPFNVILFSYPDYYKGTPLLDIYKKTVETRTFESGSKDGFIMILAKWLTDTCLHIAYIREQIKTSILQYELIGTNRIATDILTDYFLKNFSKQKDWGYMLDDMDSASMVLKPMSALLGLSGNNKFTIDVVEYYDKGNYLNIESNLGNAQIGKYLSRIDVEPQFFIDGSNLLASALVSTSIYEDIYVPCATLIKDYNSKFWETTTNVLGDESQAETRSDYVSTQDLLKFYNQVSNFTLDSINNEEQERSRIESLLKTAWNEFALSGFSENDLSLLSPLRKHYIGSNAGDFKYKNLTNKYFPTVAPAPMLSNLYPVNTIDEMNIITVAKAYYTILKSTIDDATLDILKMNDKNGVPTDGWKQKYANFHGYATDYERSSNANQNVEGEFSPRSGIDGPWAYSSLQSALFLHLNPQEGKDYSFLSSTMIPSANFIEGIINLYTSKIDEGWIEDELMGKDIYANEIDINGTNFTLLKARSNTKDTDTGKVYARTYDMQICLPLENLLQVSEYPEIRAIMNNCISIGVQNDVLWMLGRNSDNLLKFCLVKYVLQYDNISMRATNETMIDTISLNYVNDFIGCDSSDENFIKLFFFDSRNALKNLSGKKYEDLFTYEINVEMIQVSYVDLSYTLEIIKKNDIAFPAILKHEEDQSKIEFEETHKIWKIETFKNDTCICYEALNNNPSISGSLDYYFSFGQRSIWVEAWKFEMELLDYHTYVNNEDKVSMIGRNMYAKKTYEQLLIPSYDYDNKTIDAISALSAFFLKYPKCSLKNNIISIEILPPLFAEEIQMLDVKSQQEYLNACKEILDMIIAENDALNEDPEYEEVKLILESMSQDADVPIGQKEKVDKFMLRHPSYAYRYENLDIDNTTLTFKNVLSLSIFDEQNNRYRSKNLIDVISGYHDEIDTVNMLEVSGFTEFPCDFEEYAYEYDFGDLNEKKMSFMQLIDRIPSLNRCIAEPIKIAINFKNETGVTFIHDYALDLDVSCYINDIVERNRRVGYWAGYKQTEYIKWYGDVTRGDLEYIEINPYIYIKKHPGLEDPIEIILNCCWHDESEIMFEDVSATISYMGVLKDIPLPIVGRSIRECPERSLVIYVSPKSGAISYAVPSQYIAVKLYLKTDMHGFEDEIPDIQAGFANLTPAELAKLMSREGSLLSDDGTYVILDGMDRDNKLNYRYIEILFTDFSMQSVDESSLKKVLDMKLDEIFKYNTRKYGKVSYAGISLDNIYFGYFNNVKSTSACGAKYSYYGYMNPSYFREAIKNALEYPIVTALSPSLKNDVKKVIEP